MKSLAFLPFRRTIFRFTMKQPMKLLLLPLDLNAGLRSKENASILCLNLREDATITGEPQGERLRCVGNRKDDDADRDDDKSSHFPYPFLDQAPMLAEP
jgi:hypothetical protein